MKAHLPSFDQLRNNAAECIRLAEAARTLAHKSFFIEMAESDQHYEERREAFNEGYGIIDATPMSVRRPPP